MRFDDIDLMVRRANPVPDPSTLEPIGSDDAVREDRRRMVMQIQELSDTGEITRLRRDRRGPTAAVVAAAAALVVVALVAVSAWSGDDGDDPTATASRAPAEVAESFMAAIAAGDAERVATLVTDRALVGSGGLDGLDAELRWREAVGYDVLPEPCEATVETAFRTIFRCPYSYNSIHSDELGFAPFEGSHYRVVVGDDARISSYQDELDFDRNRFSAEVYEPFIAWMEANNPEDIAAMHVDGEVGNHAITDESIALWERRTREYVETRR